MSRGVVIGAGYTGARVAALLRARGDEVAVTRRTPERVEQAAVRTGARGVVIDLATATVEDLTALIADGGPGATVVVTASPSDVDGAAEERVAEAAARAGARRIVYVSSTGVYAAAHGEWVDEDFATAPVTASGRARLAAEHGIASGPVECVRLRAAGIHGPGRGAVERMRAGTFRVVGDGDTHVSRVHVDDLAAAVVLCGDARECGPVYNVADDEPCTTNELVAEAVRTLGVAIPARVRLDEVGEDIAGMFTANRRVANGRLKRELGWVLKYPTWKTGTGP